MSLSLGLKSNFSKKNMTFTKQNSVVELNIFFSTEVVTKILTYNKSVTLVLL